jgi:hypothetical protein
MPLVRLVERQGPQVPPAASIRCSVWVGKGSQGLLHRPKPPRRVDMKAMPPSGSGQGSKSSSGRRSTAEDRFRPASIGVDMERTPVRRIIIRLGLRPLGESKVGLPRRRTTTPASHSCRAAAGRRSDRGPRTNARGGAARTRRRRPRRHSRRSSPVLVKHLAEKTLAFHEQQRRSAQFRMLQDQLADGPAEPPIEFPARVVVQRFQRIDFGRDPIQHGCLRAGDRSARPVAGRARGATGGRARAPPEWPPDRRGCGPGVSPGQSNPSGWPHGNFVVGRIANPSITEENTNRNSAVTNHQWCDSATVRSLVLAVVFDGRIGNPSYLATPGLTLHRLCVTPTTGAANCCIQSRGVDRRFQPARCPYGWIFARKRRPPPSEDARSGGREP